MVGRGAFITAVTLAAMATVQTGGDVVPVAVDDEQKRFWPVVVHTRPRVRYGCGKSGAGPKRRSLKERKARREVRRQRAITK